MLEIANYSIYYFSEYDHVPADYWGVVSEADYQILYQEEHLPILTQEKYLFLGWYNENNNKVNIGDILFDTSVDLESKTINLYAKWEKITHYLIQDTTLTSIANEVKTLSGTEKALSPETMIENLNDANTIIQAEANLINQIINSLATKNNTTSSEKIQNRYVIPMFIDNRFINDEEFASILVKGYSDDKHQYNILYTSSIYHNLELSDIAFCITYNGEQIAISEINVYQGGLEIYDGPDYDIMMSLSIPDIDFETSLVLLKFISQE